MRFPHKRAAVILAVMSISIGPPTRCAAASEGTRVSGSVSQMDPAAQQFTLQTESGDRVIKFNQATKFTFKRVTEASQLKEGDHAKVTGALSPDKKELQPKSIESLHGGFIPDQIAPDQSFVVGILKKNNADWTVVVKDQPITFHPAPDTRVTVREDASVDQMKPGQVARATLKSPDTPLAVTVQLLVGLDAASIPEDKAAADSSAKSAASASSQKISHSSAPGLNWFTNVRAAQLEAQKSNKRILVFFYSEGGHASDMYMHQVFTRSDVQDLINRNFTPVLIDFKTDSQIAGRLGVYRAGTINFYDATGNAVLQIPPDNNPNTLLTALKNQK